MSKILLFRTSLGKTVCELNYGQDMQGPRKSLKSEQMPDRRMTSGMNR